MSNKQLAQTVRDGKKVEFHLPDARPLSGYICGMDDFHWMIVTPDNQKHLVHKGSASLTTLSDDETYSSEAKHDALELVVAPFRSWVEREFFGHARDQKGKTS